MDKFFVIGGGSLQVDFIKAVKKRGFETHVFDLNPACPGAAEADVFHCISIDKRDDILAIAQALRPVAVQTTAAEVGNLTACYVGETLGLHTNRYETAVNTTDKSQMKRVLVDAGIACARYVEVGEFEALQPESFTYPVVVKPADRSAGRGVSRVHSADGLRAAFDDAIRESWKKVALVEEYITGRQYSVETISSLGQHRVVAITEETFDGSDFLIETRHMMPACLSPSDQQRIEDVATRALSAVGVRAGAGHIELRMTADGPVIIELASRAGGLRDFMAAQALGCDYNDLLVDASLGRPVTPVCHPRQYVVSVFLIRQADVQLYRDMKATSPERILREEIHQSGTAEDPKTLMDSGGFFYLGFDTAADAERLLQREESYGHVDRR